MLDFRLAWRRLCATPIFLTFAVVSIAVAVGIPTSIYAVVSAMLWPRSLTPDNIVFVTTVHPSGALNAYGALSYSDYLAMGDLSAGELAASADLYNVLALPGRAEPVRAEAVSGNYFELLGLKPAIGQGLGLDPRPDGLLPIVLSHDLWERHFLKDREILGRPLNFGNRTFWVQGIGPRGFAGLRQAGVPKTAVWISIEGYLASSPLGAGPEPGPPNISVTAVGRLREGQRISSMGAEVSVRAAALDQMSPGVGSATRRAWSVSTQDDLSRQTLGNAAAGALLVMVVVGLLLIVACTNLANLTWARGVQRLDEVLIRRALGASRFRILFSTMSEGLVLSVLGAVGAYIVFELLTAVLTLDVPVSATRTVRIEPALTGDALAVAVLALLAAVSIFVVEPSFHMIRAHSAAKPDGASITKRAGTQRAFIRWQVAICTCFVFISVICGRVVISSWQHDSGVQLERLTIANVDLSAVGDTSAVWQAAAESIVENMKQYQGLGVVSVSSGMPFGLTNTPLAALTTPDKPFRANQVYPRALVLGAVGDIFTTLGLQLVRGRPLSATDERADRVAAVVSEQGAKVLFGTTDVVGREFLLQLWRRFDGSGTNAEQSAIVVGVMQNTDVGHLYSRLGDGLIVVPYRHAPQRHVTVALNRSGDQVSIEHLQQAIRAVQPSISISGVAPGRRALAPQYTLMGIVGIVGASLSVLTLLLTAIGLYGIQSQRVASLVREIGLRSALGASPYQIRAMILRDAVVPVLQGIAIAIVFGTLGRAAVRAVLPMAFPVVDIPAIVGVSVTLLLATIVACLPPTNRAARVDPATALRHV